MSTVLRWGPDRTMPDLDFDDSRALTGAEGGPSTGGPYECLPLTVHGETTGLLHVRMTADATLDEGLRRLMLTFGDVIKRKRFERPTSRMHGF
jgi:hypothetical protein